MKNLRMTIQESIEKGTSLVAKLKRFKKPGTFYLILTILAEEVIISIQSEVAGHRVWEGLGSYRVNADGARHLSYLIKSDDEEYCNKLNKLS